MRHYEIVFLMHPDQSDQTQSVLNKFSSVITESGGKVHRSENIGRRKLAYPIQDQFKASYALMNVECNQKALDEIKSSFKFNDAIFRDLILVTNKVQTEISALSAQTEEEEIEIGKFQNKTSSKEYSSKVEPKTPKVIRETESKEEGQ